MFLCCFFFFNVTATTEIYTLSLHDALPILAKLKHNVDPEVQDLLPEAVELAKQKKRERLQTALNEPVRTKNYGMGIFSMSNPGYGSKQYL